jgi:hypothetical protein
VGSSATHGCAVLLCLSWLHGQHGVGMRDWTGCLTRARHICAVHFPRVFVERVPLQDERGSAVPLSSLHVTVSCYLFCGNGVTGMWRTLLCAIVEHV